MNRLSAAGVLNGDQLAVDLDVEHVPRAEHDERDLGVALAGRLAPLVGPSAAVGERSIEAGCAASAPCRRRTRCIPRPSRRVMVNALSMPEGRLIANACACESPTITMRAGPGRLHRRDGDGRWRDGRRA